MSLALLFLLIKSTLQTTLVHEEDHKDGRLASVLQAAATSFSTPNCGPQIKEVSVSRYNGKPMPELLG